MLLDRINTPKKLKRLPTPALMQLAAEIREFLVKSIAVTGGHLASNLGVVELTLALHKVFDSPKDKIIWDVGHQSYVHKIITGRKSRFHDLRKLDGLSGFPKTSESAHDAFDTGHSSTSISAALGLATARDLRYGEGGTPCGKICGPNCTKNCTQREKIIAVIGDGSMTGGLAYEGLNNAGRADTDLIVILNDNQMSIGENVGAISRHLNDIRTGPLYLGAKQDIHRLLDKLPLVGGPLASGLESVKASLKYLLLHGVLFQEMGFRYFGPVDGHDIPKLLKVLGGVKKIRGPVLVHVLTKKGKGYEHAEHAPSDFHGVGAFNARTGKTNKKSAPSYTDVFSDALLEIAAGDEKVVAITAAMAAGTGLEPFEAKFPKRYFDVGIAEGHAVTFAAGLATCGMKPVLTVYSSFLQRAYDQVLHDVALQNLPVVFAIDRAGIVGEDGETHQGLYDIAYLSHIPNMTVLAPKDGAELTAMLKFALGLGGPVAIRYPRDAAANIDAFVPPIEFAKSQQVYQGKNIALVSVGTMMKTTLEVASIIRARSRNRDPSIYNARFVKPLDTELVARLRDYKQVFVLEDASCVGGYASQLQVELVSTKKPSPYVRVFAFPDKFIESGAREELFERYGLDAESIAQEISRIVAELHFSEMFS